MLTTTAQRRPRGAAVETRARGPGSRSMVSWLGSHTNQVVAHRKVCDHRDEPCAKGLASQTARQTRCLMQVCPDARTPDQSGSVERTPFQGHPKSVECNCRSAAAKRWLPRWFWGQCLLRSPPDG